MKRLMSVALLGGAIAMLPHPAPADAAVQKSCLREAIDSCDKDFPGNGVYEIAVRGWCYIIRTGMCGAFD